MGVRKLPKLIKSMSSDRDDHSRWLIFYSLDLRTTLRVQAGACARVPRLKRVDGEAKLVCICSNV